MDIIALAFDMKVQFNLNRHQEHILAHLDSDQTDFVDIPHLEADQRLDRIWRFIAIIFLAHANQIDIIQEDERILVMRCEIN